MNSLVSKVFTGILLGLTALAAGLAFLPSRFFSKPKTVATVTPAPSPTLVAILPLANPPDTTYASSPAPELRVKATMRPTALPTAINDTQGQRIARNNGQYIFLRETHNGVPANQTIQITPTPLRVTPLPVNTPRAPTPFPASTPAPLAPREVNQEKIHYQIIAPSKTYSGDVGTGNQTVGEITRQIARNNGLRFVYQVSEMGWFVTELANVKNNPRSGLYWFYYINGKLAEKGVDQIVLKPGDTLTWKYSSDL